MPTRIEYGEELKKLNGNVLEMTDSLRRAIELTSSTVTNLDSRTAQMLIRGDDLFDRMERSIEKYCIDLVVKQAPVASDWRRIASIMRIVSDLERIADHCSDISGYVIKLTNLPETEKPENMQEMFSAMNSIVCDTIDAFVKLDTDRVLEIMDRDDVVDTLFDRDVRWLSEKMKRQPETIDQCVCYLFIEKYVERMSDHSVNVAGWIPYIAKGEYKI